MKLITNIILALSLVLSTGCSLDSFETVKFEQNQLDSFILNNKINLKVGIKIPDGIEPLIFNTVKDRNEFIISQREILKFFSTTIVENYSRAGNSGGCTDLNGSYMQTVGVFLSSYVSNTYYSYCNNEFVDVTSITSTLTGWTVGMSYIQTGYFSNVNPTYISYVINGTIDYYIIVEGIGQVWSESVQLGGGFSNGVIGSSGAGTENGRNLNQE